jgi:hypothetical protein
MGSPVSSANSTDLWLSIIILFLLVFFLVEGSVPWSVDEYMRKHPEKDDWEDELSRASHQRRRAERKNIAHKKTRLKIFSRGFLGKKYLLVLNY